MWKFENFHKICWFHGIKKLKRKKIILQKFQKKSFRLMRYFQNYRHLDHSLLYRDNELGFQIIFIRGFLGGPLNLWSFRYPNNSCFIAFLCNNFSKMWSFRSRIFWKISQHFQTKFLNFFQNRKNYHFSIPISSKSPFRSKFGQIFS